MQARRCLNGGDFSKSNGAIMNRFLFVLHFGKNSNSTKTTKEISFAIGFSGKNKNADESEGQIPTQINLI